jgi:gliding motility-associated-like protein
MVFPKQPITLMSELKLTYLRALALLTVLWCAGFSGFSQGVTPTKGKDFWMGFMKNYETEAGESLDLFIVSDVSTSGTVSVPGQSWTFPFTVSPNATTTVSIPNSVAEMYSNQVVEGRGVHIETQDTVAVFAISFNPYTADGTKVLPTPSLGTSYMVAAYNGLSPWDSELLIVATEDDTEVEIIPSVETAGGNAAGVAFTVSLDQGESYQVLSAPELDLTGTIVRGTEASGSCRPFAVFSGAGCTNLPSGCIACDHIYEQNWPLEVWGTEYYVTPFVFDLNPLYGVAEANYTYRVLASVDGTSVSIDGGAPFILNAGEYEEFQYEPDPHCIEASQPVSVIQYMEGISCGGNGDPAMLILDDVTKKIDNITFSTVESTVITSHYLNLVIDASDLGNVTLDGITIDPSLFTDFPGCPGQLWAGFEISSGSHTLDAPGGGVTGYVYGNGDAESYAYSVGSFSPVPPIEIDDAFCTNDAVTLQIGGNFSNPFWYNYTDPETILFEGYTYVLPVPIQNGIYVGVGSEFISGCEEEFYFSVEVPTPPVISVTAGDTNICQYESVQLNVAAQPANAVYYYEWTPSYALSNDETANPIATPLISTTYTVTVTTPTGCATNSASVTINVADGNIARFEADPEEALFCVGDGVEMSVVTEQRIWSDDFNPGIAWGDWGTILNGTESTVCGSVSGNAMYFNGNGQRSATTPALDCTDGGTVYFSLKIANGVSPCDNAEPGDNIVLEYSTDGANYTQIQTYFESAYPDFVSVAQPIPVAAQSANTQFRWRQLGTFANNQDNWVLDDCYIGAVRTEDFTYTWTPAAGLNNTTESTVLAAPTVTTTYYVELVDPETGCSYTDSVLVDVGQPFGLQMSPDVTLCDVQGVELSAIPDTGAPSDYTFAWTPAGNITGAFSSTPTVTPVETTTYVVTVTSEQGCVVEDSVTVVVNTLLDLDAIVSDNLICAGDEITLSAIMDGDPDDVEFSWTPVVSIDNPTSAVTTAMPDVTTTFVVEAIHVPSGCALTESVQVTVNPLFEVTATPDYIENCTTQGIPITASATFNGPLTWSWTPAANVSAANQPNVTLTQNASVDLVVTATNPAGCSAADEVTVIYYIETTDLGPDVDMCAGESITLEAGWPDTYTFDWSNGASSSSLIVTETGTYSVTVTSPIGCVSQDEVEIEVFEYPEVELGLAVALCEGESHILNAGGPELNYVWSTGATTPEITVTTTGQYFVTVDNGVCESMDGVSVIFNPLPVRPFAEEGTFCFGFPPYTLELDAGNPGYTYVWNTGETNQVINVPSPGFIQVQITSDFGCSISYGILIDEVCPGSVYIPNSFSPDGDGINDAWMVYGENIESLEVSIFSRWGEMFFWSNEINKPWIGQRRDGEYFVEPGAYVYLVKVRVRDEFGNLSDEMQFTGHVTIVR